MIILEYIFPLPITWHTLFSEVVIWVHDDNATFTLFTVMKPDVIFINRVVGSGRNERKKRGFFGSGFRFRFGYPKNFQEPTTVFINII